MGPTPESRFQQNSLKTHFFQYSELMCIYQYFTLYVRDLNEWTDGCVEEHSWVTLDYGDGRLAQTEGLEITYGFKLQLYHLLSVKI